jgi:hypothetical protein
LYEEDKKSLRELIFFAVNNSRYTFNDFNSMDISELFEIVDLISKDIDRKNKANK